MVTTPAPYTKSFAQIVQDFAAAAQASSEAELDFNIGSVWLALAEATGGNADWLQKLYLFALSVTRLVSSNGNWVDTFCADYMPNVPGTKSPRLPSTYSTGIVTFSRATPQSLAVVPVGALVATFDGSQTFQVYADPTNSAYSATFIPGGGFILPSGVPSVNVGVQALNPGIVGNVLANTITRLQSSVVGVDTVTNPAPFLGGQNPETDAELKAHFQLYIQSLRGATEGAIGYAITSLQQGLQYTIHENVDPTGATDYGAVTVYVDDGSGNPPATTVQNASAAVNAVRAAGVRVSLLGATTLPVSVVMTITTATGYNHPTVVGAVVNAVGAYIDSLGLENSLSFTELAHVAYLASAGITNVTSVTLNGGTDDLIPAMGQTIKANSLVVS
jgi:Baseplate J-like protein